jgi:DNA-binding MarR family transcriptional regulator
MSVARVRPVRSTALSDVAAIIDEVRRLERGLRLRARAVAAATGASAAQLFVLEQLARGPALSLAELATRTLTDRSSVSVVVDRLVEAGYAARRLSRQDRRRLEVRITSAGRRILARAPASPTQRLLDGVARLTTRNRRSLRRGLAALNHQLGFADVHPTMLFEEPHRAVRS